MDVLADPQIHLWTRREYHKIAQLGFFDDKRVELIEGQIFEMSPMGSLHATAIALVAKVLESVFSEGYFVRWQMPLTVGELSEPEPDLAIIAGDIRDYSDSHPSTAALVVEIADTSLEFDRTTKVGLYAKAGIADYWIVNLNERQLEVFRDPVTDSTHPYGFKYADVSVLTATNLVTPLQAKKAKISVADLLP